MNKESCVSISHFITRLSCCLIQLFGVNESGLRKSYQNACRILEKRYSMQLEIQWHDLLIRESTSLSVLFDICRFVQHTWISHTWISHTHASFTAMKKCHLWTSHPYDNLPHMTIFYVWKYHTLEHRSYLYISHMWISHEGQSDTYETFTPIDLI